MVTHLGESIHRVLIQDDAYLTTKLVSCWTSLLLMRGGFSRRKEPRDFGMAVNTAVSRSDAFYVFVLNSDTEVKSNILPLLCSAFDTDPELATIVPAGNSYDNFDLGRYTLYPGNYIRAYYLRGHAS